MYTIPITCPHLTRYVHRYSDNPLPADLRLVLRDAGVGVFAAGYYMHGNNERNVLDSLFAFFEGENIEDEYKSPKPPASHEVISALLLLERFSNDIRELGGDPKLAARMIMGCRHKQANARLSPQKHFENRLISLLNGSTFDVDSLDYIQRDSWASGVNNVEIDYIRLLSALMIKPDTSGILQTFFKKSALSVLENVSMGRNYLYKWIYSHHKVQYEQRLLQIIVEKIDKQSSGNFCSKIFSIEALTDGVEIDGHVYYLPTDDDLIHTMKLYRNSIPEVEEYLSRNYTHKALWKTFFEYKEAHFKEISDAKMFGIWGALDSLGYPKAEIFRIPVEPKMKSIPENEIFI